MKSFSPIIALIKLLLPCYGKERKSIIYFKNIHLIFYQKESCRNMWNILFGYDYTSTFNSAKEFVSALKLDCLHCQIAGTDSSMVLAHAN